MSKLSQRELIRRFYVRLVNEKRIQDAESLLAKDLRYHDRREGQAPGQAGFIESLTTLFNAIPDVFLGVDNILEVGDLVVVQCHVSGSVAVWPIPSESLARENIVHVLRIKDGKITELWTLGGLVQHLEEDDDDNGAGPAPPGPRWIPPKPVRRPRGDRSAG